MKKASVLILIILATAITLTSCGRSKRSEADNQSTTQPPIEDGIEGTFELPTHQSQEQLIATEKVTEAETEVITEQETAKETAPPVKEKSLEFTSYGNGTCAVNGIGSYTDLFIVIPERSPQGDVVTAIEDNAFSGNREIKAIEIPSTISYIGAMAFGDCPSLVYISVDSNNKSYTDIDGVLYSKDGSALIAYPAACGATTLTLSKGVVNIAAMAFYGCDTLGTIQYEGSLSDWSRINIGDKNYGLYTASVVCNGGK